MSEEPQREVQWRHWIEYVLFMGVKKIACAAPAPVVQGIQQLLYGLLFYVFRINRRVVETNLRIAFPNLSESERYRLAQANYRWSSRLAVLIFQLENWVHRTEQKVSFHNLEVMNEALEENKGVILLSAHFGYWEMIVPALSEQGYDVHIYVGEQTNPLVNKEQNRIRGAFGPHLIHRTPAARFQFFRALRGKSVLAMLVDQNDRKSSLFVDFFGKACAAAPSTAGFHLARKSPIVITHAAVVNDRVQLHFERLHFERSGNKEADILQLTQTIFAAFEGFIRKHPEQYFWMHRRWKTRPPEDPEKVY